MLNDRMVLHENMSKVNNSIRNMWSSIISSLTLFQLSPKISLSAYCQYGVRHFVLSVPESWNIWNEWAKCEDRRSLKCFGIG